jgi:hypothetical protein
MICSVTRLRESLCPRLVIEVILDLLYPHVAPPTEPPRGLTQTGRLGQRLS